MRYAPIICILALFLLSACSGPQQSELKVGSHTISVALPKGWELFDYGQKKQLKKEFARISFEDLGLRGYNLDKAVDRILADLGEDERRGTASRDTSQISGRKSLTIDTWDRFSHQYRKRYLFILNDEGRMLVIYMMAGPFEEMEATFLKLAATLEVVEPVVTPDSLGTLESDEP